MYLADNADVTFECRTSTRLVTSPTCIQWTVRFSHMFMFCLLSRIVPTSFSLLSCWSSPTDWGHIVPHTNWPSTSGKTQGIETPKHGTPQWGGYVHSVFCCLKDGHQPAQCQTTSATCERSKRNVCHCLCVVCVWGGKVAGNSEWVISLTWVQLQFR